MKIRNKYDGTEITSANLIDDGYLFILSIIRHKRYYGVHCFYKEDGWEEVAYDSDRHCVSAEEEFHTFPCNFISLINHLDTVKPDDKMCLSNGECAQIKKAWLSDDWETIIRYIKKYTEE